MMFEVRLRRPCNIKATHQGVATPSWNLCARVAQSEVKYPTPTPTFPKFPTPTPLQKGNEIWLLKLMEIVVHSKKSLFQQKFQKKLYHFNRNSQFKSMV